MLPGMLQWKIGEKIVTTLSDSSFAARLDILLNIDRNEAAALQREAGRTEELVFNIQAFLVQGKDHGPILIDTGIGVLAAPGIVGNLLESLALAGVKPAEIESILITHLHPDHCFGLTDGKGNAVYPHARLVIPDKEMAYWVDQDTPAHASGEKKMMRGGIRVSLAPYEGRITRINEGHVAPGITAIPLPGHTPGHTGYRVESGDKSVLVWGDVVQVPAVQARRPDTNLSQDIDPSRCNATRRAILTRAAEEHLLVAGSHLEFPGFAHVERDDDGFKLIPALWVSYR